MKTVHAKYGIKINSANPDGSSQDEINAVKQLKGQSRAPDVLDIGQSFGVTAQQAGLLAPYKVATWDNIPDNAKASDGTWYSDYGGYVAIGYDSSKITTRRPASPICSSPSTRTRSPSTATRPRPAPPSAAVYAAALANGGSFDNIQPGIDYFGKLHKAGNFVPVNGRPGDRAERADPDADLVGLPRGVRSRQECAALEGRHPVDGHYCGLLRPGHQQDGTTPGRRPALGGIPLLDPGSEPLAARQGAARSSWTRWSATGPSTRPLYAALPPAPSEPSPSPPSISRPRPRHSWPRSGPPRSVPELQGELRRNGRFP